MAEGWKLRFARSLHGYITKQAARNDYTSLLGVGSVDDYIDNFILEEGRTGPALALRALAVHAFERAYYEFEKALNECGESPLEHAMLLALTLVSGDRMGSESGKGFYFTHGGRPADATDWEYISIEPQAVFGDYRVDFLVTLSSLDPVVDARTREQDESRLLSAGDYTDRKIVVECDGHDFHDRTKDQASRDRERDRALQSLGLRVFRYTGSDVWLDVMSCATETIDVLQREMREAGEGLGRRADEEAGP